MKKILFALTSKFYAALIVGFFITHLSFAQNLITGTVTDTQSGDPLVGASILIKGTTTGALTSDGGQFSINASNGDILVVSYVGYTSQEVPVTDAQTYAISMVLGSLDEVVITGYSAQSKRNVSGAVSTVEIDDIRTQPAGSIESSLQGRVAGVQVSTTGVPGSGTLVRIRGFGTINNNQPLYIIDGLPVQGGIIELNPNDIKEMTVLKDASAASIYGSRASNGVIIITTKNGSVGGKSTLTFDAYVGSQWFNNFPELVDPLTLALLENWEKPTNNGQPTGSPFYGTGASPVLPDYLWPIGGSASSVNEDEYFYSTDVTQWNGITRANKEGTDWFDEIFNPGMVQNYNLSATGGNQSGQYAIGVGHLNQEGHRIYSGYERTNVRANSVFRIKPWLRVGQNLNISYSRETGNRQIQGAQSIIDMASRQPAIIPVHDISGVNFSSNKGLGSASNNPVQMGFQARHNINNKVRALGSTFLEVDILPSLTAKTSFSADFANSDIRNTSGAVPNDSEPRIGNSLSRSTQQVLNWTWYNTLTFSKTFADVHELTVLAGTEAIENTFRTFGATRINFLLEDIDFMVINAGPTDGQSTSGSLAQSSLFSLFGKVNYAFAGKYLLSATIRRDGSSRFGPNNRFAVFPAFSLGWRISDEDFFNASFINELKLRGGWGKTGNQNIDNLAQFTLFSTAEVTTATYDITGSNNSIRTGIQGTNLGNPNLKWEETTDINLGLDATLFNALTLGVDLYQRTTEDLLLPVPPSTLLGIVGSQFRNVGTVQNTGFDINLGVFGNSGDFNFNINLVASRYKNEVVALDESLDFIAAGGFRSNNYTRTTNGYPISSFFGLQVDGIFQTQEEVNNHATQNNKAVGRFKFADINNDGVIDDEDRTFLGSPHPDLTLGWNTTLGWKNFDLNMFWFASIGNELAHLTRLFTDLQQFQGTRSVRVLQSFGRPGVNNEDAILPIYGTITADENGPNSYYIQDGSYLRMKSAAIGYTIDEAIANKIGMSSLRVYIQTNNLVTFTGYEGLDPEIQFVGSTDLSLGLDGGFYPIPRSAQIGITAKF